MLQIVNFSAEEAVAIGYMETESVSRSLFQRR
jgi:hypothetical protein